VSAQAVDRGLVAAPALPAPTALPIAAIRAEPAVIGITIPAGTATSPAILAAGRSGTAFVGLSAITTQP
jgi:hypothetical protein